MTPVKIGGINFLVRADLLSHKPYTRRAESVPTTDQQDIFGKPTGHFCPDGKCNPFGTMRQKDTNFCANQAETDCNSLNSLNVEGTFLNDKKSIVTEKTFKSVTPSERSDISTNISNVIALKDESVTLSEQGDIFSLSKGQNSNSFLTNQSKSSCKSLIALNVEGTNLDIKDSAETEEILESVPTTDQQDIFGKPTDVKKFVSINSSKFITPLELSKKINCSDRLVRKFISKGRIKARRVGKRWLISEYDSIAFINEINQQRLEEKLIEQKNLEFQKQREESLREAFPDMYWFKEFAFKEWGENPIGSVKSFGSTTYHDTYIDLADLLSPYRSGSKKQFLREGFTENFVNGGPYLIGTVLDFIQKYGIETVINVKNIKAVENTEIWLEEKSAGFDFSGKIWKKPKEPAH